MMPSTAAYSREDCRKCKSSTLHRYSACVHCGTVHEYERVKVRQTDIERDMERSRRRGAAKSGEARRKRGGGSGNVG